MRNLNVIPSKQASQKATADDNVLPPLNPHAKLLARSEKHVLQHSLSASNLQSASKEHNLSSENANTHDQEPIPSNDKPRLGKLRRRSTMHWSGANPMTRQKKLEDVAAVRLVDTWFSLHLHSQAEPFYISEEIENAMNPSFRAFDLNALGPAISRKSQLLMKLWAKTSTSEDYSLLLDIDFNLRSLQFLGKSLDNFHHPLPTNCVLFHMTDGIYTSFTDLAPEEYATNSIKPRTKGSTSGEQSTSSFDALMRLSNLDECIQDALDTREKLEARINTLIDEHRDSIQSPRQVAWAEEAVHQRQRSSAIERKQLRQDQRSSDDLRKSLESRRTAMHAARENQTQILRGLDEAEHTLQSQRARDNKIQISCAGQIRRVCEDLLKIFPIEPIPRKPLHFTIRNLPMPNSKFDDVEDREVVAAALGFTAHLVVLLSQYLSVPLPYPIRHLASTSLIEDPISVALPQRVFPLYPVNMTYRFEYGVFLMNKDIEFLMDRHNLRMLDIRHTLPNLKYLTYVLAATAGTGELPARKAGGIKGLLPGLSRRSSEESVVNGVAFGSRTGSENSTSPVVAKMREKEDDSVYSPHGSPKQQGSTFRSRALRLT